MLDIPMKWSVAFTLGNVRVSLKSVLAALGAMNKSCLLFSSTRSGDDPGQLFSFSVLLTVRGLCVTSQSSAENPARSRLVSAHDTGPRRLSGMPSGDPRIPGALACPARLQGFLQPWHLLWADAQQMKL